MADVIGFLLVLLDVIAVGAAEDFPVQVADVVAGGVFAVLGKLDGKAVVGRLVFAGDVALDDLPRVQAERLGAGHRGRIEQFVKWAGRHGLRAALRIAPGRRRASPGVVKPGS